MRHGASVGVDALEPSRRSVELWIRRQSSPLLRRGQSLHFVLTLVGGGGSILAVPLLVYLVGVPTTHSAIGTSSIGVALAALIGLIAHARAGNVRWPCAGVFSLFGIFGAAAGAWLGKATGWRRFAGNLWRPDDLCRVGDANGSEDRDR